MFLFLSFLHKFIGPLENRLDWAFIRGNGEGGWAKYYTVEKYLEFEHGVNFKISVIKHTSEMYKCHLRE